MSRLFSDGHRSSPVSVSPLGECNAIESCGFGESELTFVLNAKTAFRRFHKLVSGQLPSRGGKFAPSMSEIAIFRHFTFWKCPMAIFLEVGAKMCRQQQQMDAVFTTARRT